MRRWPIALALGWWLSGGCQRAALEAPKSLCIAGDNIFCRCEGGEAGTKRCGPDGESFGPCSNCQPRSSSSSGSGSSSKSSSATGGTTSSSAKSSSISATASGSSGTGGASGSPVGTACNGNDECATGDCRYGYCTMVCSDIKQCWPFGAECIAFENAKVCMPTCKTAADCQPFVAPPSACGWTKAIDGWGVTACSDWGVAHELMPAGSDCKVGQHTDCNLGYLQRQHVCNKQGLCAIGCYTKNDCPAPKSCVVSGDPGNCQ